LTKLHLMGKSVDGDKIYDDEIVRNISKELSDRLTSLYLIGDAIRAIRKPIKRKEITADEFRKRALDLMTLVNDIFRDDSIYEWWTLRRELE
jgi:predicted nucleic acid-binding protein